MYYEPEQPSKNSLKRAQEMLNHTHEAVRCEKCGTAHSTFKRVTKLNKPNEKHYFCIDCVKKAMMSGKPIEKVLFAKEPTKKKAKVLDGQVTMFEGEKEDARKD